MRFDDREDRLYTPDVGQSKVHQDDIGPKLIGEANPDASARGLSYNLDVAL